MILSSLLSSPVVCTIYGNGSYTAGCTGRLPASGSAFSFVDLILTVAPSVFLAGMLIMTKYYEYPYGRFLWKFNGIVGVGVSKAMSAAILGKVYRFTEKYLIFVPMGAKKKEGFMISAVPESVHQIEQKAGGLSVALVDLDVRTTVNPDAAEWADTVLAELTDTKDWPTFLMKWRYADLLATLKNIKVYFPIVTDWNPGTDSILLPKEVPGPGAEIKEWTNKLAKDASPEEKAWYVKVSNNEHSRTNAMTKDFEAEKAMLVAAIGNQKSYVGPDGKAVQLEQRDKFAYVRKLNEAFANAKGEIKDAVIGGKVVTAQMVAGIMRGVPNPEYVDALRENIHEQESKKKKANVEDMMKFVVVAGVLVVILVVAVVALNKFA